MNSTALRCHLPIPVADGHLRQQHDVRMPGRQPGMQRDEARVASHPQAMHEISMATGSDPLEALNHLKISKATNLGGISPEIQTLCMVGTSHLGSWNGN